MHLKITSSLNAGSSKNILLLLSIILTIVLTPVVAVRRNRTRTSDKSPESSIEKARRILQNEDAELYKKLKREHEELVKSFGENDLRTMRTLAKLAFNAYYDDTDHQVESEDKYKEALALYETIYPLFKDNLGEGHKETIEAAENLADLYSLTNQEDKAIDLYKKIHQLQKGHDLDLQGTKATFIHTRIALALSGRGESEKALEMLRVIHDIRQEVFGPGHPHTTEILHVMGIVYLEKGSPLDALKVFNEVHKWTVEREGPNDPSSLEALMAVGDASYNATKYEEAVKIYHEIHELYVQLYGREDERTLTCRDRLADAIFQLGEWETAELLYTENLHLRVTNLEPTDSRILFAMKKLIVVFGTYKPESPEMLSAVQAALAYHENRRTKLGLGLDLEGIDALEHVGEVEFEQGQVKEAFNRFKQAYDLRVKLADGEIDLGAAETLAKMAAVKESQFLPNSAIEYHAKAYEVRKRLLGEDDPLTLDSMEGMAVSTMALENWDKAADLFEQLYQGRLKVLGPDDDETVRAMSALGYIYKNDERWEDAEEIYRKIYESKKRTLDPNDLEIVDSIKDLGVVFVETGKKREAIQLLKEVLRIQRDKLGEDDEETQETQDILHKVQAGIKSVKIEL